MNKTIITLLMGLLLPVTSCGSHTPDVPDAPNAPKAAADFTDADYAQHLEKLKKKVPKGFTIVIQKPFVVIGDESPAMVRRRAEHSV